jgi:hypothetical protein
MYENNNSRDWLADTPGDVADPTYVDTESERWDLLLRQPLFMTPDLLKYGPLTVEGYLSARCNSRKTENSRQAKHWPIEPSSIARVLEICGVDAVDAGYASTDHAQYMPDTEMAFASAMLVHIEVLKRLGLPLDSTNLLDALEHVEWGHTGTDDFKEIFKVMHLYLRDEDPSVFLSTWLPKLKSSSISYGNESLGIALAKAFPDCDPLPLRTWCRAQDDQQGLGFLVWQKRADFKEWLTVAANPGRSAAQRGYREDAGRLRDVEQAETLHRLIEKMPASLLSKQYQELLQEDPAILDDLLERTYSEPHSTLSISWISGLTQIGALSHEHAAMLNWLERAHDAQRQLIDSIGPNTRTLNLDSATYRDWQVVFESDGERTRDLIARHMAMSMSTNTYSASDIEWLTGSSIGNILCTLRGSGRNPVHQSAMALFPCLCNEDKATVGMHIMRAVISNDANAGDVLKEIKRNASYEMYADAEIIQGSEVLCLIRAMTKVDTDSLTKMCSVLGVTTSDPMFVAAVEGLFETAFGGSVRPALPEMQTSDAPAY